MSTDYDALVASALSYAARGWHVFPIYPPTFVDGEAVCTCRKAQECETDPGKHPRCNWVNGTGSSLINTAATSDPDAVSAWWTAWPNSSIGIATGRISGIYVVDVDKWDNGFDTLGAWEAKHGFNYDTLRVLTPSGGCHFYFAHPGVDVKTESKVLGPGIDIRGEKGMAVAPPSLHKSNGRYIWHYDVDPTGPREPTDG